MALFGKKDKGQLVPKQGVDKNGHQYTRNVKTDQPVVSSRISNLPAPYVDELTGNLPRQSSADVLVSISPASRLGNVTADQLNAALDLAQKFGVDSSDYAGFRKMIADGSQHGEWTERGFGSRFTRDVAGGNLRDVHLYSISEYSYGDTYPDYYEGQAELRRAFGLPEYNGAEIAYLAGRYWDTRILPALGNIPADGARGLRQSYVMEIVKQPHLVGDIIDGLKEKPRDEVGHLETYMRVVNQYVENDFAKFLGKLDEEKFGMARNELINLRGFSNEQMTAIRGKVNSMEKEVKARKRAEKKNLAVSQGA